MQKLQAITDTAKADKIAKHIYLSAVMLARPLTPEELRTYVALNREILMEL